MTLVLAAFTLLAVCLAALAPLCWFLIRGVLEEEP